MTKELQDAIRHIKTRADADMVKVIIDALEQEPCEDAISRKEALYLIGDYDLSMGQVVKGIHALPSVQPKPIECDDVISREAVIDAIRFGISNIRAFNDTTMVRFYERENEALEKAIDRVNALPSVQPSKCEECGAKAREISKYSYEYGKHDVIEDIKADIEASRYGLINDGLDVALRIIDKHTEGR